MFVKYHLQMLYLIIHLIVDLMKKRLYKFI